MLLDARQPEKPAGVLIDTGTGKRIPFARKVDYDTGDYEYLAPAPNGTDIMVDPYTRAPVVRRGKAVGRLELVPFDKAAAIGCGPPKKVPCRIEPLTKDEKIAGLEQYKKVYIEVWQGIRGESRRCVEERFTDYLGAEAMAFLDCFRLRTRPVRTGGIIQGTR